MAGLDPLPPLNALRAFVVAGRLGNFTAAAAALGVSQPAVSRHIAVLEAFLGVRLFGRTRTGTALTAAGTTLLAEAGPALERIAAATAGLREEGRTKLRLRVYATFAVKWLLPRLPRFQSLHPDVELELSATATPIDFGRDEADLAVQFGPGTWPGLEARALLPDLIQPVCSPALWDASDRGAAGAAAFLGRHRMLHSHYRRRDWPDWLRHAGLGDALKPGQEFPSSVLSLQAAAEGLGVAIGQVALLGEDVAAGRLVPVFGPPLRRALGHYLVWPTARPPGRKGRAFADWLLAEAGEAA